MLGEVSSVLEECTDSVLQHEEFKLLLQKQKDLSQVDHNGKPLLSIIPLNYYLSCLFLLFSSC